MQFWIAKWFMLWLHYQYHPGWWIKWIGDGGPSFGLDLQTQMEPETLLPESMSVMSRRGAVWD
jgi:hypothetical protein